MTSSTVPEGYTVRQIARRLAERGMADETQFLSLARTQGRTFHVDGWTPPDANLEGYLFPDTYRIPRGTTPRQIIAQMLGEFHSRVVLPHQADFARYPGGLPAAITLASLVEREAEVDADRPLIASALDNRLKQGMRLQCDATVQYALPEHKSRLFYGDLRVNSPYNTYLHAGLPPTPIASPGLPSIEAALHPAQTDYLFYVARPGRQPHLQRARWPNTTAPSPPVRAAGGRYANLPTRTLLRTLCHPSGNSHPDDGRGVRQGRGPAAGPAQGAGHHAPSSPTWTTPWSPGGTTRSRPAWSSGWPSWKSRASRSASPPTPSTRSG